MEDYWDVHLPSFYLKLKVTIFVCWSAILTSYMAVVFYRITIKLLLADPAVDSIIMSPLLLSGQWEHWFGVLIFFPNLECLSGYIGYKFCFSIFPTYIFEASLTPS